MAMFMYAIVLEEPNSDVSERIDAAYNAHYKISETVFLVHSDKISDGVANDIGLKGDNRIDSAFGVVLKLNGAYAGYATRSVWEWLSAEV